MPRFEAAMGGGNPDYKLVLYTSVSGTTVGASLYWRRAGSSSYTSYSGAATASLRIQGVGGGWRQINFNAPAGGAIGETFLTSWQLDVGAVGSASVAGFFNSDTSAAGYGEVWGAQSVATVPPAPTNNAGTPDQITTTTMRYMFTGAGDGGSGIIRWEYQVSDRSDFAGAPLYTSSGTTAITGLTPNTTYYLRARGVNAVGNGAWSSVASGKTLAASAPALSVAAAPSGTSATLTVTPHSSQPSPQKYLFERRTTGTTTPVTTGEFATSPHTLDGLTQGRSYDWRVAAVNGTYTSPFTAWQTVQQPNPNTNPGDYFDGSTAASGDTTYAWTGVAGKSSSRAVGKSVTGWVFAAGNSGASGSLSRQVGGRSQGHAARLTFTGDATAVQAGIHTSSISTMAKIAEGGRYTGSMYVQLPGRSQRLAIRMLWYTAASAYISETPREQAVLPASSQWVRLSVTGNAPQGVAYARLVVEDATGTGWSAWQAGDILIVDDAMISLGDYPYFDGNTTDTPEFDYTWTGAANASPSARLTRPASEEDLLADPDCPPPPLPPRPPVVDDDCIDDVGSWRRYWAVIPEQEVSRWVDSIPAITLKTGALPARQARVRLYENPDELSPDLFDISSPWVSEQVVSYIPPQSVFVIDGVLERARASVRGGPFVSADYRLHGTGGGPATWPILSCGLAYLMSVDVPLDSPDGNLSVEVSLTKRM